MAPTERFYKCLKYRHSSAGKILHVRKLVLLELLKRHKQNINIILKVNVSFTSIGFCFWILLTESMTAKENKEFVDVFNKMSGRIKTVTRTVSTKKSILSLLEEVKKVEPDLKDESKYNF